MKHQEYITDLCVVGGGIAGICTAVSAARHGIKVVLIQDRPVLGGNSSSEIRMWVCGAHGDNNRETGIVEEMILENYYLNPNLKYPLWDATLYGLVKQEDNITLLLNSSVLDAECKDNSIINVTAWQSNAETFHKVYAKYFADCSGDSILAPLSNAMYRYGREAKNEFNETIPPEKADKKTMGMSCLFQIRETDHYVPFVKPDWAYTYETDDDLPYKDHELDNNFWWIEVGGLGDCIHDSDKCRDECIKICYGVWDHIKNKGNHGADNFELEWIGFLPGKRESRRYVGEYIVTQNDVESEGRFDDLVAYAGWTMDDHFPQGFYYTAGHPTIYHPAPRPWGLPLRCMISKNIKNLTFAGRNISVTHSALSSSRVMATCGVLGQALGTAIAQSINSNTDIRNIDVIELQNTLMQDDCYLPWHKRKVSELSNCAKCNSEIVRNGFERDDKNLWIGNDGDYLEYFFEKDIDVRNIRIVFDSNLNRTYHNMPCRVMIVEPDFHTPQTLIKSYDIFACDSNGHNYKISVNDSHQRFVNHSVNWKINYIKLVPKETYGSKQYRIFDFEIE